MHKFDVATAHREEHEKRGEAENEQEKRYIDNLLSAVNTADEQCKKLEYWSDVRDVVRKGEAIGATRPEYGWGHEWAGVDASGPDPNAIENVIDDDEKAPTAEEKGKGKATDGRMNQFISTTSTWIDGTSEQLPKREMEDIMSDEDELPGRLSEDVRAEEAEGEHGSDNGKALKRRRPRYPRGW